MEDEGFKRKITAIMSADVAGYSKLMADDEAATVKILALYRQVISSLITQHRGRVIDSPGDNILSEFASVVDAVQCAVAIQKELQSRNAELREDRKMRFRIGVNLGDVIEEGDHISHIRGSPLKYGELQKNLACGMCLKAAYGNPPTVFGSTPS